MKTISKIENVELRQTIQKYMRKYVEDTHNSIEKIRVIVVRNKKNGIMLKIKKEKYYICGEKIEKEGKYKIWK